MRPTRFALVGLATVALLLAGCRSLQNQLLYFPTHHDVTFGLAPWRIEGRLVGYAREVPQPRHVWLLLHGNGGQAADRQYALACFDPADAVYILEYPGYGQREGEPSRPAFEQAAREGYADLRQRFPATPVGVVGESLGTGPASWLATGPRPPDKIVLVVPFDELAAVARRHYPWLPVGLLLRDNWNNVESLRHYPGPVDLFAARSDRIIPVEHAEALAAAHPSARLQVIPGGHNDWASSGRVRIRFD